MLILVIYGIYLQIFVRLCLRLLLVKFKICVVRYALLPLLLYNFNFARNPLRPLASATRLSPCERTLHRSRLFFQLHRIRDHQLSVYFIQLSSNHHGKLIMRLSTKQLSIPQYGSLQHNTNYTWSNSQECTKLLLRCRLCYLRVWRYMIPWLLSLRPPSPACIPKLFFELMRTIRF